MQLLKITSGGFSLETLKKIYEATSGECPERTPGRNSESITRKKTEESLGKLTERTFEESK